MTTDQSGPKDKLNSDAEVARFTPSEAVKVRVKSPASAESIEGVIVNTLFD